VPTAPALGYSLLDHEELIGRRLGPPDLTLSASELPHADVTVG
jgi:hypothetical protein